MDLSVAQNISHPYLLITSKDHKLFQIKLKEIENSSDKDLFEDMKELLDENLSYEKYNGEKYYFLKKKEINEFLGAVEDLINRHRAGVAKKVEDTDSESDSTDDEMIQRALARRFKYTSTRDEIADGHISESQDEESVSLSRRLRHIYKRLTAIESRLSALENK